MMRMEEEELKCQEQKTKVQFVSFVSKDKEGEKV
jgi:hypothetical protein